MRAICRRWRRLFVAMLFVAGATACATVSEPAYDPTLVSELTELARETATLFRALEKREGGGFPGREQFYDSLSARAETIRLLAEARPSATPAGARLPAAERLAVGASAAGASLVERAGPDARERLEQYNNATAGYMRDYLRNLALLERKDRDAGENGRAVAAFQAGLEAHERSVAAYLDAFRAWQSGTGPQPEPPGPAPSLTVTGLTDGQLALRRAAIVDILRDALIYERDILNRSR